MALTGIGGWARRFLSAGASAFVGAYWSVYDEPAFGFAKELYMSAAQLRAVYARRTMPIINVRQEIIDS